VVIPHRLDDPLWNSLAVNWFLLPRAPRLRGEIEKKLSELRIQGGLGKSGESIVSLEAARNDLEQTRATVDAYKSVLSDQASNVVNFWTNSWLPK
jgi:hypothetical protein